MSILLVNLYHFFGKNAFFQTKLYFVKLISDHCVSFGLSREYRWFMTTSVCCSTPMIYDAVSSRQELLVRLLLCWDLSEDCHSNSEIHTFWGLSICLCFVQSWSTPAVYGAYSMTCVWTKLIRYILLSLGWTDIYALFVLFCDLILLWKGALSPL
jgi:hypothetical protein